MSVKVVPLMRAVRTSSSAAGSSPSGWRSTASAAGSAVAGPRADFFVAFRVDFLAGALLGTLPVVVLAAAFLVRD